MELFCDPCVVVPSRGAELSEQELYEQLRLLRDDVAEIRTRLFQAWKRNRWRHELLHLENLLSLTLVLDDGNRDDNLRLLKDSATQIMKHFSGEEGGEVIVGEAASFLCLLEAVEQRSAPEPDRVWSRSEGS